MPLAAQAKIVEMGKRFAEQKEKKGEDTKNLDIDSESPMSAPLRPAGKCQSRCRAEWQASACHITPLDSKLHGPAQQCWKCVAEEKLRQELEWHAVPG